jgi:hypothetical protein
VGRAADHPRRERNTRVLETNETTAEQRAAAWERGLTDGRDPLHSGINPYDRMTEIRPAPKRALLGSIWSDGYRQGKQSRSHHATQVES